MILGPPSNQVSCTPMVAVPDFIYAPERATQTERDIMRWPFGFADAELPSTASPVAGADPSHIAIDPETGDKYVLYTDEVIYKLQGPIGDLTVSVWKDDADIGTASRIKIKHGFLWWVNLAFSPNGTVYKAPLTDPGSVTAVVTDLSNTARSLGVGDNYLWVVDNLDIYRYDLDGTNRTSAGDRTRYSVTEHGNYIYFAEPFSPWRIKRMPIDLGEAPTVLTGNRRNNAGDIHVFNDGRFLVIGFSGSGSDTGCELYDEEGSLQRESWRINGIRGGDVLFGADD